MAEKKSTVAALSGALIGALATLSIAGLGYFNKNRDLDIKMVEIALGILREDPEKSNIAAVRSWAVDLLDAYSGVPLSTQARSELLKEQLIGNFYIIAPDEAMLEGLKERISRLTLAK